jgi:hypothetical protein
MDVEGERSPYDTSSAHRCPLQIQAPDRPQDTPTSQIVSAVGLIKN